MGTPLFSHKIDAKIKDKLRSSPRLVVLLFFIFVIIEGFGTYEVVSRFVPDINNLVATTIEISAAIFITLVIFVYDTREKRRTKSVLDQIKTISDSVQKITESQNKILTELYERGKKRKHYHFVRIKADLAIFKKKYLNLIELVEVLRKENNAENHDRVVAHAKLGKELYESMRAGIIADFNFVSEYVNNPYLVDKFAIKLDFALGTFSRYSEPFYTGELYKVKDDLTTAVKDIDELVASLDEEERDHSNGRDTS